MKNIFRRLALSASIFLSLAFLLVGCLPSVQKLKVNSDGSSSDVNVRVGDVLPILKIPLKEGCSFVGWKQNGMFIDVETPLLSIETLEAEYIENTEKTAGLTFERVENGLSVTGIETEEEIESLIIPAYVEKGEDGAEPVPVVSVSENAFRDKVIRAIVFPDTMTEICAGAFADSTLPHLFLPSSLLKIDAEAFRGASGFQYFDVPENVLSISTDAFIEMRNKAFRSFGKKFVANDGGLFEGTKLLAYPAGAASREYKIPDYVKEVGEYAFYRQTFGKLRFGKNLERVAAHALEDASVSELDLNHTEILRNSALRGLTTSSLVLPETLQFCGELALDAVSAKRVVFRGQASYRKPGRPNAVLYASDECYETLVKLYPAATVFSESCLFGNEPMIANGKVMDCPDGVESLSVENTVTEIAPFALNVKTLTSVTFCGAPPVFGASAFRHSSKLKIYVPEKYLFEYRAACPECAECFIGTESFEDDVSEVRVAFTVDGHTDFRIIHKGEKISLPAISVAGKILRGWNSGGTLFRAGEEIVIEKDAAFVAEFEKMEFTVVFYADGKRIGTDTVSYEGSANAPTPPVKPSAKEYDYSFDGWDKPFDFVTEDLEINAVYRKIPRYYTVEFYSDDGLLKTESVRYGDSATAPNVPVKEPTDADTFRFDGWDKPFSEITESVKIYASFTTLPRFYTVTYYAGTTKLKTESVEYWSDGTPPVPPIKPSSLKKDFVFLGWDTDVRNVRTDLVVYALYCELPRLYTVNFYSDGKLIKEEEVEYGKSAAAPKNPGKEATEAEEYRFAGWDKAFDAITGETEVNAMFESVPKSYAVRFYSDGKLLKIETVVYGEVLPLPEIPSKPASAEYRFVFVRWDKDVTVVTENVDVHAVFRAEKRIYTVKIVTDKGETVFEKRLRYGSLIEKLPTEWDGKKIERITDSDGNEVETNFVVTGDAVWTAVCEENKFDPYAYTEGMEFEYDYEFDAYGVCGYYGDATNIVIPERYCGADGDLPVAKIGRGIFAERRIDTIKLPDTILVIEGNAFFQVTGLSSVVLPKSLISIGSNAFYSDSAITVIVTGDALTDIAMQDGFLLFAEGALYELYAKRFFGRWDIDVSERNDARRIAF